MVVQYMSSFGSTARFDETFLMFIKMDSKSFTSNFIVFLMLEWIFVVILSAIMYKKMSILLLLLLFLGKNS